MGWLAYVHSATLAWARGQRDEADMNDRTLEVPSSEQTLAIRL